MTEKGEFVVLIEAAAPEQPASEEEIKSCIAELAPGPESSKELAENIAKRFKVSRNRAYQMILDIRKKRG